jgi:hypothetical protein
MTNINDGDFETPFGSFKNPVSHPLFNTTTPSKLQKFILLYNPRLDKLIETKTSWGRNELKIELLKLQMEVMTEIASE